uniref:Venom dipeptidyl peptidase 4 n=1 Tax=Cacopsylla melanoneura TaxID=428564 RepID=A0A8D8VLD5_9HEMI
MNYFLLGSLLALCIGELKGSPGLFSRNVVELQDVLSRKYSANYWNGTWISDDSFTYPSESTLMVYNLTTKSTDVKFSNLTIERSFHLVSFSNDWKYALYVGNKKQTYRHSYEAQYKVLNIESKDVHSLDSGNYLQLVQWFPVGHDLVFIKNNNIYYLNDSFESTDALTTDGVVGVLYNGLADWVYEEEVLSSSRAFWFSPDGKMLVYMKFNDRLVHDMSYMHYGDPRSNTSLYPDVVTMKYPKAGSRNPVVELHLISFDGVQFEIFVDKFTFSGDYKEAILTDVVWTEDNEVVVTWTNRIQTHANTFRCALRIRDSVAACTLILDYHEEQGWVDLPSPVMSQSDYSFLTILPTVQEDFRNYPQLVLVKPANSYDPETLTQGKFTVTKILGWDQTKNVVFYQGVRASHSSELHVYMYQMKTRKSYCLSCSFERPCSYATAAFSKEFTYFTLICQGPGVPFVEVRYTYTARSVKPLLSWENNEKLKSQLEDMEYPVYQDLNVPLESGFEALVRLQLPKRMDRSGRLKYPLILNVYGGPTSNIISDRYSVDFHTYLVSKRLVVVARIDARGSSFRSKQQEFAVYRNLGRYEIEDQIAVVKYLTQRFQFIDKAKVGIWGWSYGGFDTAMVLGTDKEGVFQCGVSVAPVTNFLYYDSIYTERYMGLPDPSDNEAGYNRTDVTRLVDNFANKSFLLMHGTADDNVHYQQSMMLTKALEEKDIFFLQQSYPDQAHSIASYQHHVYHTINHFWTDCLGLYPGTV